MADTLNTTTVVIEAEILDIIAELVKPVHEASRVRWCVARQSLDEVALAPEFDGE